MDIHHYTSYHSKQMIIEHSRAYKTWSKPVSKTLELGLFSVRRLPIALAPAYSRDEMTVVIDGMKNLSVLFPDTTLKYVCIYDNIYIYINSAVI